MKRKLNIYILLGIIILLTITFGIYLSTFVQPKISISAKINPVNKEEYEKAMVQVLSADKGIEKFKHINLEIKVMPPFALINNVCIEKAPSEQYLMKSYLKNNDKIEIPSGGVSANGKGTEYIEYMTVYMKDMPESELKNVIGDLKIIVSWQNIWGKEDSKISYLKDYLK